MFTQENIGCHKTFFCDGLALNKNEVCFNISTFVKAFTRTTFWSKQDVLSDDDTKRFAFYHAGKCLVQTLLLRHPKTPLFKLTEPKNNAVSSKKTLSRNLISGSENLLSIETRINLETLLIGFYAGKVGEFFYGYTTQLNKRLFLIKKKRSTGVIDNKNSKQSVASALPFNAKIDQFLYQSDIGLSERLRATSLVEYILVNGSIYSPNFFNLKKNSILGNLNKTEILERKVFALFKNLQEEMSTVYGKEHRHNQKNKTKLIKSRSDGSSTSNRLYNCSGALATTKKIDSISQNRETSGWCEEMVCKALTFYSKPYGHWFRIYLPQIETHQRQPASLDKFFTKSRELPVPERSSGKGKNKVLSEATSIASTYHLRRLQSFTEFKVRQSSNRAKLCLNLVQPLPCMKLSAKLSGNTVCVQVKTSDLDEHSKKSSTGLEARLQLYLLPTLNLNLFKSTHSKKAQFYTNFACNSSNIVTQKLVTKPSSLFYLWPQEFGHGTSHNLVLNTFSQAFNLIGKNRELLDILADHFIRFGKIRMPEISRISLLYVDMTNFQEKNFILSEKALQL